MIGGEGEWIYDNGILDPLKLCEDVFDIRADGRNNDKALLTTCDDESLKIKQSYADDYPKLFKCNRCGGKEFNVASEEYFTAIRCPKCLWEAGIHNG